MLRKKIIKVNEPENLDILKDILKEYHSSGLYMKQIQNVIDDAQEFIQSYLNNSLNCVVFDIDETCISEYNYMLRNDFAWTANIIEAAQYITSFPAITPVQDFLNYCLTNGLTVFIITSKRANIEQFALKEMSNAGYPDNLTYYFRPDDDDGTIQQYKYSCRKDIIANGYTIIANIGDQPSDFDSEIEGNSDTSLCEIKIPDPYYLITSRI